MKRWWSPYPEHICPGQESVITRLPEPTPSMVLPSASKIAGWMPKKGFMAAPGFSTVEPGNGQIKMPPVSVCHHVSTMGERPSPTTSKYHSHASGLIGSPTEPSRRSDLREV